MTVTKQMGMMIMLRSRSVCRTDPLRLDAEMVLFSSPASHYNNSSGDGGISLHFVFF